MNILIINHELYPIGGGSGRTTYNIAEKLAQRGHNVTLLSGRTKFDDQPDFQCQNGLSIHRVWHPLDSPLGEKPGLFGLSSFIPLAVPRTLKIISSEDIDVINAQLAYPAGALGVLVSKITQVPLVTTLVGGDVYEPSRSEPESLRKIGLKFVETSNQLTANNSDLVRRARDFGLKKDIEIVPYGVDTARYQPSTSTEGDGFHIVSLSRLAPRKNYETLIRAVALLDESMEQQIRLSIAGSGPEMARLEELCDELGIHNDVTFLGFISEEEKVNFYNSGDVFSFSPLHEGLPGVVLEAMACGLPIVATDVGGISDQVDTNGYLVPKKQPKALADALKSIIKDGELRKAMGDESRRRAEQIFSWNSVIDNWEQVLTEQIP